MSELRLSGGENHIPNVDILHRIREMGDYYSERYAYEEEVVILNVLQGASSFAQNLAESIDHPKIRLVITQIGSREGTEAHIPKFKREDLPADVTDKALLVVESIDHTRATLHEAMPRFRTRNTSKLDLAVLLNNTGSKKVTDFIDADTVQYAFNIPDVFAVGFSLDWKGLYRDLKHVTAAHNIGGETPETEYYVPLVDKREAARLERFGRSTVDLSHVMIAGL